MTITSSKPFSRFDLPGLNLPLNWQPCTTHKGWDSKTSKYYQVPAAGNGENLFPNALNDGDDASLPLLTLREITMIQIMDHVTDKPGWEDKVFDDKIVEKWKEEAPIAENCDVSESMMDWIIKELRHKAKFFKEIGAVTVFHGDVVKSDMAIPTSTKEALQAAVQVLEDIPDIYKDWHPNSDEKVLDLVHPSLYPLIYGRSRVLKNSLVGLDNCIENCGNGVVVPVRSDIETFLPGQTESTISNGILLGESAPYGKNFQWLPSDVDISAEDGRVKITSYINNLHPESHQELYAIIEDIIAKAIPQWGLTLGPIDEDSQFLRIELKQLDYDWEAEPKEDIEIPERESDEDSDEFDERAAEWASQTRPYVQPEPECFKPMNYPQINFREEYGHRGLQIIVKLANIELTPEKPYYEGGTWHVEGQLNEHICATALYYYDCENITESRLAFRQQGSEKTISDIYYRQNEDEWLSEIYGCTNWDSCVQEVGSVLCREGRLLTFPNMLQHQVQPFKLADPAKKGHRKVLALFLVDPAIRIISTANVPPQQKDWWREKLSNITADGKNRFGQLSAELKDKIVDEVEDFPIGIDEAKEIRLKLMAERSKYVTDFKIAFENSLTFSLCEH